jgi:hypothetical protein
MWIGLSWVPITHKKAKECVLRSVALIPSLGEKLGRAPCVESMSTESKGERVAFVNSLELWVRGEVVKETAQEREKELELEMRMLRQQNEWEPARKNKAFKCS